MAKKNVSQTAEQQAWEGLVRQIGTRKDILAGTLSSAYLPCNKGDCKCTRGELHGPTWRLGYRQGEQSSTVYVRVEDLPWVKAATGRYAELRGALLRAAQKNLRAFLNAAKRRSARRRRRRG